MPTNDNKILQMIAQLRANGASEEQIQQWAAQNGINLNVPTVIPASANASKRIFAGLSGLRNKFGKGNTLLSGDFALPNLGKLAKDVRQTKIIEGGPTIGGAANTISGIYQGGKALTGFYENSNKDSDLSSLKEDINLSIASNPMYDMNLTAADEKILRQMQNGTLTNNWAGAAEGAVKGIPQAALSAVMGGLTGGPLGAIIGGAGSLLNSGISGYGQKTDEANAKLQGLYSKLRASEDEYNSMKRPRGLRSAGLSSRYYNQLY